MNQKQQSYSTKKKTVLKNFAIFTRKNLRRSLFLKKLQAFRPLLKRDCNSDDVVTLHIKLLEGEDGSYNAEIDKTGKCSMNFRVLTKSFKELVWVLISLIKDLLNFLFSI